MRHPSARAASLFLFVGALAGLALQPRQSLTADAQSQGAAAIAATATFPPGDEGRLVRYGHQLITKTPALMAKYVTAGMSCEACHLNGGRKPHGGSLLGIFATYPKWSVRAHRFIALQDRLAECFLYSMNGRPPAYTSREMIALTAYIAFLSRGARIPVGFPHQDLEAIKPSSTPDPVAGKTLYQAKCSACHGVHGSGNGTFPPLWGPKSFNNGAGMHRLATMAAFVRYNMPYGAAPNSLSPQEAYDVSAFVLSHARPVFAGARPIAFPAKPAVSF